MSRSTKSKTVSLIVYLCITLKGQMIGLPFFLWLPFSLFNFWNVEQLLSLLAILALFNIFVCQKDNNTSNYLIVEFTCFLMLALPIIGRLAVVPTGMFNYFLFIIPTTLFFIMYSASILFNIIDSKQI